MVSDHLLPIAITISLIAHGTILLQASNLNLVPTLPKKQKIEVRYVKESLQSKSLTELSVKKELRKPLSKPNSFLKLDSKIITGNRVPPPYIEQSSSDKKVKALTEKTLQAPKPAFASSDLMAIKKKIILPPIDMAKINNPSYINYYQAVREKIRRSAYQNYIHNEIGEVYVSFIISNDGYIKNVRLVEEKTTASNYLKSIALKSVKDASPFSSFPKELDYPQLSFNIIISFEIE